MVSHLVLCDCSSGPSSCSYHLNFFTAMMIEVMAGKSAALHGMVHDATPFRFSEKDTAIDYFGKMLEAGIYCVVEGFASCPFDIIKEGNG